MSMLRLMRRPKVFLERSSSMMDLVDDEGAAGGEGFVGFADEHLLLFEVPVVEDVAHHDDVGVGDG